MVANFLSKIIEKKRERLAEAEQARPLEELRREALNARTRARRHAFREALSEAGRVNVIAEFKRASPSKGEIRAGASARETARAYERGGAAAVSVLTEADFFRGSLGDLAEVKESVRLPLLRKDFIVEDYQVYESAAVGADALLLIVAALDDATLARLRALAEDELGLDALVEVHTEEELRRASAAGARIVGVNNRDLDTLVTDVTLAPRLRPMVPPECVFVAESGVSTPDHIAALAAARVDAVLIGEALLRAPDPGARVRQLVVAGRPAEVRA